MSLIPYPQSPVTVQVTVTRLTWQASLCASDVVPAACQFCVCHMAVSHVRSVVGHLHVISVTGRCSFSSFHDDLNTFDQTGLMLSLEGTVQLLHCTFHCPSYLYLCNISF